MRPISPTLGCVKIVYAVVCFFKEEIRSKERTTTAIVDVLANDIGKYINPKINAITRRGGIFSSNCSIDFFFCNPIKRKHPDAISQNLDGIKKYAAD